MVSKSEMFKGLKLAFFGSDQFSIGCLEKLLKLKNSNPARFSQIDIVTRSAKRAGRDRKQTFDVPIASFAQSKGLTVRRCDTKLEMNLLAEIGYHICVAVSFGKLIPSHFLESLQFGGLNVHPSLLPRYSGASPLQHALLNHDRFTGVTLQTLHPTQFDRGEILLQEAVDADSVADPSNLTLAILSENLSSVGGDLLCDAMEHELYMNPQPLSPLYDYSYAGKIRPEMSEVDWDKDSADHIVRKFNTLGPLYTFKYCHRDKKVKPFTGLKRIIVQDVEKVESHSTNNLGSFWQSQDKSRLYIKAKDGVVSAKRIKFEGFGYETPEKFLQSLTKRAGNTEWAFVKRHTQSENS